jgi:DNA-directed RNA polymerase specialized sigma24 family protein
VTFREEGGMTRQLPDWLNSGRFNRQDRAAFAWMAYRRAWPKMSPRERRTQELRDLGYCALDISVRMALPIEVVRASVESARSKLDAAFEEVHGLALDYEAGRKR